MNLRVGLVGLGNQAEENILPSLLHSPSVTIAAVCDQRPERAREVGRYVAGFDYFAEASDMLAKVALDAVVVVCPPDVHRDVAHLAMSHGVSVFVEKPPCATLGELEALAAAARTSGVVSGVGMNFRFARPIRQLRAMAAKPSFGKAVYLQLNHYASKPTSPMWGLTSTLRSFLLAQTIHTIDLAVQFGGQVRECRPAVIREGGTMVIEIGLSFESGATASILTGTMFPYFEFDMKLVSDTSTMVTLDNLWNLTLHAPGQGSEIAGTDKRWRGRWQPGPLDSGFVRSGYKTELDTFFDCVRQGQPFEADLASLLPTYEVIEQVCRTEDAVVDTRRPRPQLAEVGGES
jgi:predicted dehydrogenase